MKRIFILLTSMFLLAGCIESLAVIGGGATNGKLVQSSLQSAASYGVKKATGETPLGHVFNYAKKTKSLEKKDPCSSFVSKKENKICLIAEKRIISKKVKLKEKEFTSKPSKELTSSLRFSINEKSKIRYLD